MSSIDKYPPLRILLKPPSVNSVYRIQRGRIVMLQSGHLFKTRVAKLCAGRPKIPGFVTTYLRFYWSDKRRRDLDNHFKVVIDAIKGILFGDDCMVKRIIAMKITEPTQDTGFDVRVLPFEADKIVQRILPDPAMDKYKPLRILLKPPSFNSIYIISHRRLVMLRSGHLFKSDVAKLCAGLPKIHGWVTIYVRFYWSDRRRRDLDNYFKVVVDAIKGVLFDDDYMVKLIVAEKITEPTQDTGFDIRVLPFETPK
jgi:Holliday junction resolvase RusA-like endonuclease